MACKKRTCVDYGASPAKIVKTEEKPKPECPACESSSFSIYIPEGLNFSDQSMEMYDKIFCGGCHSSRQEAEEWDDTENADAVVDIFKACDHEYVPSGDTNIQCRFCLLYILQDPRSDDTDAEENDFENSETDD
jgi:predicted Fe-S protein YdhL (DUF1289 family)